MGYHRFSRLTGEGLFSAAEVGASHIRQRLFVLAYSERGNAWRLGLNLAGTSGSSEGEAREQRVRADSEDADRRVANGNGVSWGMDQSRRTQASWRRDFVADPDCKRNDGRQENQAGGIQVGWAVPHEHPNALSERCQGLRWSEQGIALEELEAVFPPGPDDLEAWARVLTEMPEAEPAFCRKADGVAWWLDATAYRAHRLRVLGNGVVPLVVAYAFRTLYRRALE